MQVKAELVTVCRRMRQEEQALLAGLSESERSATGTVEEMAAKDLVAHVTAAKQRQTQRLAQIHRGEIPAPDEHTDPPIFAYYQHWTWQAIEEEAERTLASFLAEVDTFREDELVEPQRYPWMKGSPLAAIVVVYGVWHPAGHLAEALGVLPEALRLDPSYLANARHDSDLDALRGEAVSQALFAA